MILRVFRARQAAGYDTTLMDNARQLRGSEAKGLIARAAARHLTGGYVETVSTSYWVDIEAVREYTGGRIELPVLPDDVIAILDSWSVEHFEVYEHAGFEVAPGLLEPVDAMPLLEPEPA